MIKADMVVVLKMEMVLKTCNNKLVRSEDARCIGCKGKQTKVGLGRRRCEGFRVRNDGGDLRQLAKEAANRTKYLRQKRLRII